MAAKVNIAIPTYNRSDLLKLSLESALSQGYTNLIVTVLDNASTDNSEAVVRSFDDPRIHYVRHETNIGMLRNWNRAIAINPCPFLMILQDDDLLHPSFISQSMAQLEQFPQAGFCFTDVCRFDECGDIISKSPARDFSTGLISGIEYLRRVVDANSSDAWDRLLIQVSSVLMRASAIKEVGCFDALHTKTTIEFNLYFRLATRFDIVYVAQELAQIRRHSRADGRNTEVETRSLGMLAERCDAATYLLRSDIAQDPGIRQWLADRMSRLSTQRSAMTAGLLPDYGLSRTEKIEITVDEISALIPPDHRSILIDENELAWQLQVNRKMLPFTERDGLYWGPPVDDETAVLELERMRRDGASFVVILWPAFWYLDFYRRLERYLFSEFSCVIKNSRVIAFDMR